jgi:hypothetical protein
VPVRVRPERSCRARRLWSVNPVGPRIAASGAGGRARVRELCALGDEGSAVTEDGTAPAETESVPPCRSPAHQCSRRLRWGSPPDPMSDGAPRCRTNAARGEPVRGLQPTPRRAPPAARLLPAVPHRPLAAGARPGNRHRGRPTPRRERRPAPTRPASSSAWSVSSSVVSGRRDSLPQRRAG